ncbi:MAG: MmcQ/YjbR family DNA-binding protein [Flavobacteriales bacterium]|jgi:predicted DNA-binding protein (MmcQ/YjbR family)|nr:MmcQ/YjbR family DNA-binding protein [Flavobacteriales bacterium]
MDILELREFCLSLPKATEEMPFGPDVLVFKVGGKMFCLINIEKNDSFNVKCDPEKAIELREKYAAVLPGYHMSKKHWNTVKTDGSIPKHLLKDWISDSYCLVLNGLSKKKQKEILGT